MINHRREKTEDSEDRRRQRDEKNPPSYKGFKLQARFYNAGISINTKQRLILNVDGNCKEGLLVSRKMLAISRNLITPFL